MLPIFRRSIDSHAIVAAAFFPENVPLSFPKVDRLVPAFDAARCPSRLKIKTMTAYKKAGERGGKFS